jgi:hypothetical protein
MGERGCGEAAQGDAGAFKLAFTQFFSNVLCNRKSR